MVNSKGFLPRKSFLFVSFYFLIFECSMVKAYKLTLLSKSKYDAIIVRIFRGRKMTSSNNKAASIYEGTNINAGDLLKILKKQSCLIRFKLDLGLFVIA